MLFGSLRVFALVFTAAGLVASIWFFAVRPDVALAARGFMVAWLAISLLAVLSAKVIGRLAADLIGLFALLVGWRVSALITVDPIMLLLLSAFLSYVAGFFVTARHSLSGSATPEHPFSSMGPTEWHLTFLRLYVGLDFVPHFTEKLFAGPAPHAEDVAAFQALGLGDLSNPLVWVGGLCEFGAAVGIGLGLLTRFAAVGTALYLMIATIVGKHFQLGFIWATPGGGWEYPLLWTVIVLSFAYQGAGRFSLDGAIRARWKLPRFIRVLMGGSSDAKGF